MLQRARLPCAGPGVELNEASVTSVIAIRRECVMLKVWLDQVRVQGNGSHFARAAC
jgi:hypothetical protein